jgi:hypothetical protein
MYGRHVKTLYVIEAVQFVTKKTLDIMHAHSSCKVYCRKWITIEEKKKLLFSVSAIVHQKILQQSFNVLETLKREQIKFI